MKQCPRCQGLELYDDEIILCPYCDTTLVPYTRKNRRNINDENGPREPKRPTGSSQRKTRTEPPIFERHNAGRYNYRGVVTSISPTSRFMTNTVKWLNSVFKGQPYQLGNPVHETILRIEEISQSRLPDKMRSLVYYGELGELNVGDDVAISAVKRDGRLVVRNIVINDIESSVHTQGLISANLVRFLSLAAIGLIVLLISVIVSFFTSGGIWMILGALVGGALSLVSKLIVTLAPLAGLIFIYWLILRKPK